MIIVVMLFFHAFSFGMHTTFVDQYGNPITQLNRPVVIFDPFGNDKTPKTIKEPSIYAEIHLFSLKDFLDFSNIKRSEIFFGYDTSSFEWSRYQEPTQKRENFPTLEAAICDAQNVGGFDKGDLKLWNKNLNFALDHSLYTSPKPKTTTHPFILSILTPDNLPHIKTALTIALANSRQRLPLEGLYAIVARFEKQKADEILKIAPSNRNKILLDKAVSYFENPLKVNIINDILKEPGDEQFDEKLKNLTIVPDIKNTKNTQESGYQFSYKKAVQILLQLYGATFFVKGLNKAWLTKKLPPKPKTFLQEAHYFTILLGTGLLIKNLLYAIEPFISKENK